MFSEKAVKSGESSLVIISHDISENARKSIVNACEYYNVEYIEYNISRDEEARRNLIKLGYMSVPVTLINGNHVLGFDKLRIRQLLNGKE